jgi:hypothetical protein
MAHISQINYKIRSQISEEIQSVIETADTQNASADFIAGLETALAIVAGDSDSISKEFRNA